MPHDPKTPMPLLLTRRGFLAATGGAALSTIALPKIARAQNAGTLVYALSAYPPSLDPFRHDGAAAATVKLQLYRGLLGLDSAGQVSPELAESFEQTDDLTYVFHLRPDAVFHNGQPVTARDVKFSLEQITAEGSTAYFVNDLRIIEAINEIDDMTVEIKLTVPTPAFDKLLATPYVPVISADAGVAEPVGAGPYRIEASERGVSLDLVAFEDYYKPGLPRSPRMRMIAYRDDSLRVAALEAGDVDIIEYVPWQSMPQIEGNNELVLQETFGPSMYIAFNTDQAPFDDPRVRLGVALAINRQDIVDAAFFGRGTPMHGLPIFETSPFYSDTTANLWSYDPDRARALFQEAGVLGRTVTLLSTSSYAMHQDTAEIVQQYLIAAGLNVELALPEWGARVTMGNEGRYQFAINGGSMVIDDPDGLTGMLATASANYRRSFGYSNAELDAALAEARHELDFDRRRAAYERVAELVRDDVPIAMLTWRSQGYAINAAVQGFEAIPGILNSYTGFVLELAEIA